MKTITWRNRWALLLALSCIATVVWSQSETLIVAAFSALKAAAPLPEYWKPFGVSSATPRTRYTLVDDAGVTVVKAEANASASALSRELAGTNIDMIVDNGLHQFLQDFIKRNNAMSARSEQEFRFYH